MIELTDQDGVVLMSVGNELKQGRITGLPYCERSCESNAFKIEIRRLHAVNQELGAALRRLISYCNTLENRLMEVDGEHPALQQAKEAYAKVGGQA